MNTPFFQIVIPALNEEKFIPILLTCLSEQTSRNFEVVVIDGFSKDKTVETVKFFPANYPLKIIQHKAGYVGAQRNFGATQGSGTYIIFIDADVTIKDHEFLAHLEKYLTKHTYDFLSVSLFVNSKLLIDNVLGYFTNFGMFLFTILGKPLMSGECIIMKHSVFDAIGGFDESVVHGEDFEIVQRALAKKYKGTTYLPLRVYVSLRRYAREGRLQVLYNRIRGMIHMLFYGPIRKQIFSYPMGGENY